MKGLRDLTSRRISDAAMFTPSQPARIVLQDSTAVADAQQTDIMPRSNYEIGCELQRKRVECAIMIKAALAED